MATPDEPDLPLTEEQQEELNPDETTRREAVEQELLEEGESELGEELGDQMD
jgi:hypothetical protein